MTRNRRLTHLLLALAWIAGGSPSTIHAQAPAIATKHLYSETADPQADIAAALKQARKEHKRVLLDFGGDWCGDCQVLDIYLHQQPNLGLLNANFVLVHIWIGHMDKHLALAAHYGVPIEKGVPALAVIDDHGKVITSQQSHEFSSMRHMESSAVTDFLNRWKA